MLCSSTFQTISSNKIMQFSPKIGKISVSSKWVPSPKIFQNLPEKFANQENSKKKNLETKKMVSPQKPKKKRERTIKNTNFYTNV